MFLVSRGSTSLNDFVDSDFLIRQFGFWIFMVPWVSWSNFPSSAWFVVLQQFFLLSVKCSLTPGHHLVLMVLVINVTSENNPVASQAPLTTAD